MNSEKFGMSRYKPPGDWVQFSPLLKVSGVSFRKKNVDRFFKYVKKCEIRGGYYGVDLVPEPQNFHDTNAIKVFGKAETYGFFGRRGEIRLHIGYVPADFANDATESLVEKNIPIFGELYRLFRQDDYHEISFFILAPPGHSFSARSKSRRVSGK